MVASSAVLVALPLTCAGHKRQLSSSDAAFFNPMRPSHCNKASSLKSNGRTIQVQASLKEKAVTGLTAAAMTAAMMLPKVAEAAQPGISSSLKNYLLSIVSGGVVLGAIVGAVIGVANFDPVKRT
eukprot:TRINITY_DN15937_c0_g1_i1.p1 TRINITY_DN15937_c0_g1~~TRINITY_DN15937_c0_g1_i1.p1  ORF type:complete len:125 (-),score=29.71 TRINITY_DN15937_c0_g1_i1:267-641(-)